MSSQFFFLSFRFNQFSACFDQDQAGRRLRSGAGRLLQAIHATQGGTLLHTQTKTTSGKGIKLKTHEEALKSSYLAGLATNDILSRQNDDSSLMKHDLFFLTTFRNTDAR